MNSGAEPTGGVLEVVKAGRTSNDSTRRFVHRLMHGAKFSQQMLDDLCGVSSILVWQVLEARQEPEAATFGRLFHLLPARTHQTGHRT